MCIRDRISAADQKVTREVLEAATARLNRQNRADGEAALRALRQQGIVFTSVSGADRQRWEGAVAAAMDDLARRGVFSAQMLRSLRRHVESCRGR
jgi:TRAP-type C4-dicarboxylate transport system substrate-binding protein